MGGIQPAHYDPETVKELTKELLVASGIGAVRGAAIGLTTALLLRRFSTVYRTVRIQVRVFYHISWISMGAVFYADKQLIKFQNRYYENESKRRSKILDEAAERGIFLEDDSVVTRTTS
ncbi:LANO_0F10110g1_1 [Lachancea nothofagi CBS 11611]|uniref:LANO_0F10110g1_1 n=1 Tax=Lachancea nothofagi CBS 11611 TaxID=1266666 RepID=A0A1G4KAF6_9SACH|nr:LANO_0F10110g1_1 [Lachancea nothofagi CBS 11611]